MSVHSLVLVHLTTITPDDRALDLVSGVSIRADPDSFSLEALHSTSRRVFFVDSTSWVGALSVPISVHVDLADSELRRTRQTHGKPRRPI